MNSQIQNNSRAEASTAFTASTASKVLIITYYWPPGSGAGVQRWLKFSKYLPEFGWEPVILTVDPQYATYPSTDLSLENEISGDLKIFRTKATDYFRLYNRDKNKIPSAGFASDDNKSLISKVKRFVRGNFFIPDPRRGWNKFAFTQACKIIEREGIQHIVTTSPPHSTQLIGLKLKKKYPYIKWIADLRDPWTDIYYYNQFYPTFISTAIDRRYEKSVLDGADKIITVGKSLRELFVTKSPQIDNKTIIITNGYDEEDLKGIRSVIPLNFTISYVGTLSDAYPIGGFLKAVRELRSDGKDIYLRFIGAVSPSSRDIIRTTLADSGIEFIPYVEHPEALRQMLSSNLLLLIIPDHVSNKSIITGKIFEYMATGKPILCLGPQNGDAACILKEAGSGNTYDYYDIEGLKFFISQTINGEYSIRNPDTTAFSRRKIAGRLADFLK